MSEQVTHRYRVSGKVQGVMFRASTRAEALRMGLTGYAKNLEDGCVEVLASGPRSSVETLTAWLMVGPPSAEVVAVDLVEEGLPNPIDEFQIL